MEQAGVGSLAIVDGEKLVGIVTDRDIVRRGLAKDLGPDSRIDAIMSTPVVTVEAESDLHSIFALFRTHAVRRLAVVRDGQFVGVITIDDLLMDLAADLADLSRPVSAQVLFGHRDSAAPVATRSS